MVYWDNKNLSLKPIATSIYLSTKNTNANLVTTYLNPTHTGQVKGGLNTPTTAIFLFFFSNKAINVLFSNCFYTNFVF